MKTAPFHLQKHTTSNNHILVIDREGLIGEPFCLKLSKEFSVVFVSGKNLEKEPENNNINYVPFLRKFPAIPDEKYSQIIFIDEEGKDLEPLPKIIEKAKGVNADFIFAQGLSLNGEYAIKKVLQLYPSAKAVLFGDIFDSKLILKKESFKSTVNKFIYQAQRFGKMQVLGEGLREAYPVFLNDVVDGLIELVFKMHKAHSFFYIFPKFPPTELSLAHMIQKANPEITLDFIKHDPRLRGVTFPSGGMNLLGERYQVAQRIRKIDIKEKIKADEKGLQGDPGKMKKFPLFIIWTLLILLFAPFISTIFFSFLGNNILYYAKGEMDKGNLVNAKSSLHLSQTIFYVGKKTSNILAFQAKLVGQENNLKKLAEGISLGYEMSGSLSQIFSSVDYFSKVLNNKSKSPAEDFAAGRNLLKSSIVMLGRTRAEEKIPAQILQNLEIANPLIKLLSATADIMPNIFGMEGQKTYLILFQDNMRLRPGGGLINSYGILKFNMGKVAEFSMHKISDADKQLRGHVEPPFALRRYLPQEHWYMKDSNFDVDFVRSASSASNFLFVETGQKTDGVIAVDFSLWEKLTKIKTSYLVIAQMLSDALSQKRLMFAFKDNFQNIFTVNGWSSSLWDDRKSGNEYVNDFVGINEANLGTNSINNFIKRQVSQKVSIDDSGNISEELGINFENKNNASSGENYKSYLRIILPENTELSEISINDIPQRIVDAVTDPLIYEAKNFKAPEGLEVEKTQEDGKEIFGFIVNVPAGKTMTIKLKCVLSEKVGENAFSYNLKLFKQPGIDSIPYSLSIIYPNSFIPIKTSAGIIGGEGNASYSEEIVEDKNLIINFSKN